MSEPNGGSSGAPAARRPEDTAEPCPLSEEQRIRLVEFVELVERDDEGVVHQPGPESTDPSNRFQTLVTRTDRAGEGGPYKQYVNLGKDIDGGQSNRHPEYGQWIRVRARVEWVAGDRTRPLGGRLVRFTREITPGPPQAATADVPQRPANLENDDSPGFTDAKRELIDATTEDDGWTEAVRFYLSRYGSDLFTLKAQAEEQAGQGPSGPMLSLGAYQAWRKFWYQKITARTLESQFDTHLDTAEDSYEEVHADMAGSSRHYVFARADLGGRANISFYPEWMLVAGSSSEDELFVATPDLRDWCDSNGHFYSMPAEPVKAYLVAAEYCMRGMGESSTFTKTMQSRQQDFALTLSNSLGMVVDPYPEEGNTDFLVSHASCRWETQACERQKERARGRGLRTEGALDQSMFSIVRGRGTRTTIRVTLPEDAALSRRHPARITFKVRWVKRVNGSSRGRRIIMKLHDGSPKTIAHEIAHAFSQTPPHGSQPSPLPDHPHWYDDTHGGRGNHCSTGAGRDPAGAGDGDAFTYTQGTCIMFHSGVTPSPTSFCDTCKPYLRLQDMARIG